MKNHEPGKGNLFTRENLRNEEALDREKHSAQVRRQYLKQVGRLHKPNN